MPCSACGPKHVSASQSEMPPQQYPRLNHDPDAVKGEHYFSDKELRKYFKSNLKPASLPSRPVFAPKDEDAGLLFDMVVLQALLR